MDVIREIRQLNTEKKTAIAVGYFDGMHLGHRELISRMCAYAHTNNMLPMILTFDMSGLRAEGKGKKDLFPRDYTVDQAEAMDVTAFADIPFESICDMEPDSFCRMVLSGNNSFNAGSVFCGEDFRFGKGRSGSVEDLKSCGKEMNFEVIVIDDVYIDGEIVSTSRIKEAMEDGNVKKANQMLGSPYSISGEVIHGNHLAKDMGFPTANILFPTIVILPKKGVYLTETVIGNKKYRSITNVGTRPTITEDVSPTAETHILDFCGDLYGKDITVLFYDFIRPEQKFESAEELKDTVLDNIEYAKKTAL